MRLGPHSRPRLAAKARLRRDRVRGGHLLLYPERGLRLNATAAEILSLCDGRRTVAAITALVAAEKVERLGEVVELFERLHARGLLEVE